MLKTTSSASGTDLDPGIRDFIRITGEAYVTHGQGIEKTPVTARQVAEKVRAPWVEGGPRMHETTEHSLSTPHGDVRIRIYRPTPDNDLPALIYLHGGGWVMFSLDTHDRIMREYAARAGICVVGIDYSLSPESRFPVALEQTVAVVRHLHDQAASYGLDPERFLIGGDSAGANLSLSTAVALRDQGEPHVIKGLLLNYGAFCTQLSSEDVRLYSGPDYMLTADEMAYFWAQYLAVPADAANALATPLNAELKDLPPVFLCIPQCDVLTGQSLALDARLKQARVNVRAIIYAGASHSFLEAVSVSKVAEKAFDDAAIWLCEHI